jgi:hypothetical protein
VTGWAPFWVKFSKTHNPVYKINPKIEMTGSMYANNHYNWGSTLKKCFEALTSFDAKVKARMKYLKGFYSSSQAGTLSTFNFESSSFCHDQLFSLPITFLGNRGPKIPREKLLNCTGSVVWCSSTAEDRVVESPPGYYVCIRNLYREVIQAMYAFFLYRIFLPLPSYYVCLIYVENCYVFSIVKNDQFYLYSKL